MTKIKEKEMENNGKVTFLDREVREGLSEKKAYEWRPRLLREVC